ncbi:MAG: transketolase [Planctomycetaceae bacterium]|nr:transketolase [Planctomycetaceae bacterium]
MHTMTATQTLDARSQQLRRLVVRMLKGARRGHVGSAFSVIDILRVLYDDVLRFDPANPKWTGRDRCILSKGHGCLALYALLADKGFFPHSELDSVCAADSILGGHPDANKVAGVEASTGALGHGLSIGLGMALHLRIARSDSKVFVILGDGECNEGSVWEAAMCAGKHRLANFTAIVDYNKHQAYGSTREVQDLEPFTDKWQAFGFAVREVDGHNIDELRSVFTSLPLDSSKPTAIIAHTIKGKGAPFAENNMKWHHKNKVTDQEVENLLTAIGGSNNA